MPEPTFAIIGAQKSASTYLHDCLTQHPEIFMAPGELPWLESPDYERGGAAALTACFEGRSEPQRGFRRPNLLGIDSAAERIAAHLPRARLIAVLRNPIERALSAYHHYAADGFIPVQPPERGIRQLMEDPLSLGPRAHEILDFGFYARQLARYAPYERDGRLLVLLHDDVAHDPRTVLERAFRFLGVEPTFSPKRAGRPQAVAYPLSRIRFRRLPNHLAFRYDADGRRRRPRGGLAPLLVRTVSGIDRAVLAPLVGNERPRLSPELFERLASLYREDVTALAAHLGRDLGHWLDPRPGPTRPTRASDAGTRRPPRPRAR